jgi:hypothetical protein
LSPRRPLPRVKIWRTRVTTRPICTRRSIAATSGATKSRLASSGTAPIYRRWKGWSPCCTGEGPLAFRNTGIPLYHKTARENQSSAWPSQASTRIRRAFRLIVPPRRGSLRGRDEYPYYLKCNVCPHQTRFYAGASEVSTPNWIFTERFVLGEKKMGWHLFLTFVSGVDDARGRVFIEVIRLRQGYGATGD